MRVIRGSYGVIRGRLPPLNRTVISRTPDFTNVKFMTFASGRRLRSKLVRMTFHDFCFREAIEVKTCSYDIRRYGLRPAFGRPQPVHEGCVFGTWFGAKPFNERVQNRLQKWAHSFLGSLTYARSCTKFGGLAPCHNQCFPIAKSSRKHCNFNGKCTRLRA